MKERNGIDVFMPAKGRLLAMTQRRRYDERKPFIFCTLRPTGAKNMVQ
jgi:hypothetical protein